MNKSRSRLGGWTILFASLFYAALLRRYYVGFLTDDADYVLAARSLLGGRYSTLYLSHQPPLIHFLPGFPFFLAPFVALLGSHWAWLPVLSSALILGSGWFLWKFAGRWMSAGWAACVTFLYLFNPVIVFCSGLVISESLFVALLLYILLRLDPVLENPSRTKETWFLGLLLGWCVLTRPEGLALLLALGVFTIAPSYRSRLIPIVGIGTSMWLAWMGRNYLLTGRFSDYTSAWQIGAQNGWEHARSILDLFLQQETGLFSGTNFLRWLFEAGALALMLGGLWSLVRMQRRPAFLAAALFAMFDLSAHVLWPVTDARYFAPLLPLAFLFLVEGARSLARQGRFPKGGAILLCVVFIAGALSQDAALAKAYFTNSLPARCYFPRQTLEEVRTHIPPSTGIVSDKPSTVYLYTGHSVFFLPVAQSREEFRDRLLGRGVGYLVVFENPDGGYAEGWWRQAGLWVTGWPEGFRLLYRNPEERAVIYGVVKR